MVELGSGVGVGGEFGFFFEKLGRGEDFFVGKVHEVDLLNFSLKKAIKKINKIT